MSITKPNHNAPPPANKPTPEQVEAAWEKLRKHVTDEDVVMIAGKLNILTYPVFRKRVLNA